MVKHFTKVVYKPDTQSTDEFTVIVNPAEYKKWKEGEVVDSFDIFFSNQGSQGILGKPSKQQLENVFGVSKDVDVIPIILKEGKEQAAEGINTGNVATNAAKGSAVVDNKGKGLRGI
ncbi:FYSH domain-containing protein [Gloeophyllum trabeum ATCC 11539]|uniref:FYSH domain-containing protein n=1 Tax=Gloeophyllum trabeum (strain ATCC 11539 / FP-39264 / Madison 617) TaxID=670483 RepID=S7QIM0_GLOTA|nr:FYSH domain-containing protein [Gloeophyllum trabeum ATCC 11539]EPQ59158.1 FYSH domain-containing protein [Gloeophyllum trabeum ATCC 11539]